MARLRFLPIVVRAHKEVPIQNKVPDNRDWHIWGQTTTPPIKQTHPQTTHPQTTDNVNIYIHILKYY